MRGRTRRSYGRPMTVPAAFTPDLDTVERLSARFHRTAVTTYCNGGWDDELRARHAAEAPMILA